MIPLGKIINILQILQGVCKLLTSTVYIYIYICIYIQADLYLFIIIPLHDKVKHIFLNTFMKTFLS